MSYKQIIIPFFKKKYFFGLIILFFFAPQTSQAQYTATPLIIDLTLQARDIVTREIVVQNTGSSPVTLYPTVNNISLEEGGTIQEFLPAVSSDRSQSLSSWIEISRQGIDMKPGETRKIPITFRIHHEPKPGNYHALIGFGSGRNRDEAEAQVRSGKVPGTIINVTIKDIKHEVLKLSGFVVDRFITNVENQAAAYTFKNPGEESLIPKGEIIIYDSTGKEVGVVQVNTENLAIEPGKEHTFTVQLPVENLFGKYKAFLSIEYGSQLAAIQDTNFFYAIPLRKLIILFTIFSLFAIVGAWYFHKKYFDEDNTDDSERLSLHIKETASHPKHHDIDLKRPQNL